jgi:enhanced entry protein EnhC
VKKSAQDDVDRVGGRLRIGNNKKGDIVKLIKPLFCLAAVTAAHINLSYAVDTHGHRGGKSSAAGNKSAAKDKLPIQHGFNAGIDNYRQGKYFTALQEFAKQTKYDPVSAFYLAQMNQYGYGQLKNNAKALQLYNQAGEGGYLPAQQVMALYMLLEKKDPAAAFYWFKKSADANVEQAQMYVAAAYLFGFGVNKNSDKARQYYIGAAKQGNSIAQNELAEYFLDSRHSENRKLGMLWLEKALAQHNPKAQLFMAQLYAQGKLFPKSLSKANEWVDLAIAEDYTPALIRKGNLALEQKDYLAAKTWYMKASDKGALEGYLALGNLYFNKNAPFYDVKQGYLWVLKAAQLDLPEAQETMAAIYKYGNGIEANQALSAEWHKKAVKNTTMHAAEEAARWLSNSKSNEFAASGYHLTGIFSEWKNPQAQKQNQYNPTPQMVKISRETIYKPNFVLTQPHDIPISEYYDALVVSLNKDSRAADKLEFPPLPFDETVAALKTAASISYTPAPQKTQDAIGKLQLAAGLGDSFAQFDLGQMYQYGIGVQANPMEAARFYELAANEENLSAMVALGILYLNGNGAFSPNPVLGLQWLNNAAFKGSGYAQFALARIYEEGFKNQQGDWIVRPNSEQSDGMYFLAAANNHGLAQFRLAEKLVRRHDTELSITAQNARQALIKSLYEGAISNGVKEADLPLAFFNAMDSDKAKQDHAFKVATRAADEGNPDAALLLGLMYDRGVGVEPSPSEALNWYKKSGNNLVSQFVLGTYYSLGTATTQDKEKGQALLQESAKADFPYAYLNLAVLNKEQEKSFLPQLEKALALGNAKAGLLLADYYVFLAADSGQLKQARDIYQKFANKGDKDAQLKLAYMLDEGLGGTMDAQLAMNWYNLSAEQGQNVAQYLLGRQYQLGEIDGMPNYALAKQWYARAESNYAPAAVALGFVYDTVEDNYQQAQTSYDIAAQQHDPVGQYNLGLVYEEGKGQPVDQEKAVSLYLQAAEMGHSQSMVRLAGLYFNGEGVKKDPQQALDWYKKAAEKGDREAYYQLGLLTEVGVATKIDFATALKYYEDAAKLGSQQGMLAAARMYQYGIGVAENQKQAAMYYEQLAELGNAFAQYQLSSLYDRKVLPETKPGEGRKWLQEAVKNGSPQAHQLLQKMALQKQAQLSFIESVLVNQSSTQADTPVELLYLDALNQWNCGDERHSKQLFDRIRYEYPNYIPAKRMAQRMSLG